MEGSTLHTRCSSRLESPLQLNSFTRLSARALKPTTVMVSSLSLAIVMALSAACTDGGTEPEPDPSAEPSAGPGAEPSAGPGAEHSAGPGAEPSAGPGAEPSAGPGAEPSPGPGAEPSPGPGAEPEVPVGGATPRDIAEAYLDGFSDCDAFIVEIGYLDALGDVDSLVESITSESSNPYVAFDQDAANACFLYLKSNQFCADLQTGVLGGQTSCDRLYPGTLEAGATCDRDECAPGLTCAPGPQACGQCAALPQLGEPCTFECAEGLQCQFAGTSSVCEAIPEPLTEGDACNDENPCELFSGSTCVEGICTPRVVVGEGEACDGAFFEADTIRVCGPAATLECIPTAPSSTSATCQRVPTLGESCSTIPYCRNAFCDASTSQCVAYLADGQACTEGGQCGDDSYCGNSVCTPFDDNTDQCTE